jgi:hypothetical protein
MLASSQFDSSVNRLHGKSSTSIKRRVNLNITDEKQTESWSETARKKQLPSEATCVFSVGSVHFRLEHINELH